jgi:methionine-rich copper-binding protein CopC
LRRPARALVAGVLLALPVPAAAHSLLIEATPAARSVLTTAPERVDLRFNNRIEKRLSGIAIVGPRGERYPAVAVDDPAPDRLRASVPPLPPGDYRLEWRVLSTDGHIVTGTYTFRIAPR